MDVEKIEDAAHLKALQPEWEALWSRCPQATPFQHPGWLIPWWETFGSGQVFSFAVRGHGRELTALAPMFLHPWEGRRQVTFIGNGVSDHLDFLADNPASASSLLQALAEERERWDICDLQDLTAGGPLLSAQVPDPLHAVTCPQYVCSVVALPPDWAKYSESLPHGLKRNLRRYRAQLDAQGTVAFETAGEADFEEYLTAFFHLHRARWAMKDDKGMLDGSAMASFHSRAAQNLWAQGLVRLHGLRLNRRLIAVVYLFLWNRRAYSYLGGFDPALARFSPGLAHYGVHAATVGGRRSHRIRFPARR